MIATGVCRVTWREWETRPDNVIAELSGPPHSSRGRWTQHQLEVDTPEEAAEIAAELHDAGARDVQVSRA